jgi:hypothetical protein
MPKGKNQTELGLYNVNKRKAGGLQGQQSSPTTRSGLFDALAISAIGRADLKGV